jgi:hypothetical protein
MHGRLTMLASLLVLAGLAAPLTACAQPSVRGEQPAVEQVEPRGPDREFRTADELLTALEVADRGLVSLAAGVRYDRTDVIAQDQQVSLGRLYFVTGLDPDGQLRGQRKFAIRFDRTVVDGAIRLEDKYYIFDGEWLVERLPEQKLFIKRQVVPPGEAFDPLRIGEGPMPLPIGQKREDILSRYTADLLDPADGLGPDAIADPEEHSELQRFVSDSYQVRLVPRTDWESQQDFSEVRLWYTRGPGGNLLPRMARTISRNGDVSLVRLVGVQVQMAGAPENPQARVPAEALDTSLPRDRSEWHIQIVDWRGRAPEPGTGTPQERR